MGTVFAEISEVMNAYIAKIISHNKGCEKLSLGKCNIFPGHNRYQRTSPTIPIDTELRPAPPDIDKGILGAIKSNDINNVKPRMLRDTLPPPGNV